jgi:type I restriction enzyme S subunit
MQRLLTRGIGHEKFKKTEIGEIPAKWNIEALIEVLVLQRGFDLPVQRRIKGQYPILASNGFIDYHQEFKVKGPGIVTGRSGTLGKVHYIESNYWPLNTTLYVKEFYNNHPKFIYYFLQSLSTEKYGTGTGVPTLNRNILHKVKVAIPPLDEQIKIAEIISESDAEIEKELSYRVDLERIKTGLMQVLLTGRIRVKA